MDWLTDVQSRIKRNSRILFARNGEFLRDLTALIEEQNHRTMVLWALDLAEEAVGQLLRRYPDEKRPGIAVDTAKEWAAGRVKMREAQRAILQAHAVAKEIDSPEDIALCHAVGQACGVVHTGGHAMGFPIYDLTAIVRRNGVPECKSPVETRRQEYMDKIYEWREKAREEPREWAAFLLRD